MPRNMSFMLTTEQVRNRTKTVTRRLGWWNLQPGEIVNACVKCMGLKKGEQIEKICQIRIISTDPEELCTITQAEVIKEGFPAWTPEQFLTMYLEHHKCHPSTMVNRIEFDYVDCMENNENECELCGEKATHFCECEFCRDPEWRGDEENDEDVTGRWLCDNCIG